MGQQGTEATCSEIPGGVKIKANNKQGVAYLGILNTSDQKNVKRGTKVKIDYYVWHAQSYKGGGRYGMFGGYDVSLIKLEEAVPETPVCLPGKSFRDSGIGPGYGTESYLQAHLAGFGYYQRISRSTYEPVCQTDGYGAAKYHYCAKSGHGSKVCIKDRLPPQPKICQEFFEVSKGHFDPSGKDVAISIVGQEAFCYKAPEQKLPNAGEWCYVDENASTMNRLSCFIFLTNEKINKLKEIIMILIL